MVKIIFLYAEITTYFFGCLRYLSNKFPDYDIEVVYLEKFDNINLESIPSYKFINKNYFSSKQKLYEYLNNKSLKLLLISGRMDNDYLYSAKKLKGKCITVSLQDTLYTNSFKHKVKRLFSQYLYKQYFHKIWSTGSIHTAFALSMGYQFNNIGKGFYVADEKYFKEEVSLKFTGTSLNFLFIGRLVKEKNIQAFAQVIDEINFEMNTEHSLKVIGKGKLFKEIEEYKCTDLIGFKDINEMISIAKRCHAFCLPSKHEPWGVVLHEMALLGLPILSSYNCGASFDLVHNNINGFKFNPDDKKSIKQAVLKYINLTIEEKIKFGRLSKIIASRYNHDYWCYNLISLLD